MSAAANLLTGTVREIIVAVLPIAILLVGFQVLILKRPIPNVRGIIIGFALLAAGLVLFLTGLRQALFPLGRAMATQLTSPEVVGYLAVNGDPHWREYYLVYLFGAAIAFATTLAEPALIAVAMKASDVSGHTISSRGLRMAVATGAAIGISLGCFRIVTGSPLPYFIIPGYLLVVLQALRAPRNIVALAFDTGGVTTSAVTVPIVAALGLGLASTIPGRNPLIDGFGLIAFAALFPIVTVMGYAQIGSWRAHRQRARKE